MLKYLILVCLILVSCTKKLPSLVSEIPSPSAEEVVKKFVTVSAGAKEVADRRVLQDLSLGELKRAFDEMSDEQFRLHYIDQGIKLVDFKVLDSKVDVDVTRLQYRVSVVNQGGTEPTAETNEREVELRKVSGAWYIETIKPKGVDKLAFTKGMIF